MILSIMITPLKICSFLELLSHATKKWHGTSDLPCVLPLAIQDDHREPILAASTFTCYVTTQITHIGLGLYCLPVSFRSLAGCFICVKDIPFQQISVEMFRYRLQIIYTTFDDPVSQWRSGKFHSQLLPILLLAVKRDVVHIFLVHYASDRKCRCKAVFKHQQ